MTEDFLALALEAERNSRAHDDADRPTFHIAPPVGRLNDPNGLIVDGEDYHAFFQYTPEHPKKFVYWGHAVSRDLVHWDYLEPAILPDCHQDANGAYSGTAIGVDGGVELWYTGNYKDPETGEREATQCLVETPDLRAFTKTRAPIIATHPAGYTAHFRDPQVWKDPDDPAGSYRMMVGVQRENLTGAILLYRSADRRDWVLEGELTFPDAAGAFDSFGYMWECPNLVRLRDEATGEVRDVLVFCPQGIDPDREGFENIFPCVYVVGSLVGTELRGATGEFFEVDRGFEFYAPQVYARRDRGWGDLTTGAPSLLIGWAGNASEDDQPSIDSGGWVHALTSPRALALVDGRLVARPFLPGLPLAPAALPPIDEVGAVDLPELEGSRAWRARLFADYGDSGALVLEPGSDGLKIRVEPGRLVVDRSGTRYPHGDRRVVTLDPGVAELVEVVHDRSLTEIYLGDGRLVFTLRSFLEGEGAGLRVTGEGPARLLGLETASFEQDDRPEVR